MTKTVLQKHTRNALDAADAVLKPVGLKLKRDSEYARGHLKFAVLSEDGKVVTLMHLPSSPRNADAQVNNARQWAQRLVRELKQKGMIR